MKLKGSHIKILLSAVFITILYFVIDKERFIAGIKAIQPSLIIAAAVFFAITQAISACKWWVLVRNAGIDATLMQAIRVFYVGMFVNTVGFGTVGGDIVRALLIDKTGKNKSAGLATVVADRAIGLCVLGSIGVISGCVFGSVTMDPKLAWVAVAVTLAAVLGFCYVSAIMNFFAVRFPRYAKFFIHIANAFPKDKKVFAKVIFLAFCYHLSQITLAGYIIHALGADVPVSYILFAVPFINFLTTLPLSWMGLGLREGTYASFFVPAYFATKEEAMLVGSIWFVAMIIASAIGGIWAFLSGDLTKIRKDSAELGNQQISDSAE